MCKRERYQAHYADKPHEDDERKLCGVDANKRAGFEIEPSAQRTPIVLALKKRDHFHSRL